MSKSRYESQPVTPVNKMVSQYPRRMKPRRARYEAERARFHRWELPRGHPYYKVHPVIPYLPAYLLSRVTSLFL